MIPMGVIITATAALDINADRTNVTPYNTANIMTGFTFSTSPIRVPIAIMRFPVTSSRFVFCMAIPRGTRDAMRKITDQLIDS